MREDAPQEHDPYASNPQRRPIPYKVGELSDGAAAIAKQRSQAMQGIAHAFREIAPIAELPEVAPAASENIITGIPAEIKNQNQQ